MSGKNIVIIYFSRSGCFCGFAFVSFGQDHAFLLCWFWTFLYFPFEYFFWAVPFSGRSKFFRFFRRQKSHRFLDHFCLTFGNILQIPEPVNPTFPDLRPGLPNVDAFRFYENDRLCSCYRSVINNWPDSFGNPAWCWASFCPWSLTGASLASTLGDWVPLAASPGWPDVVTTHWYVAAEDLPEKKETKCIFKMGLLQNWTPCNKEFWRQSGLRGEKSFWGPKFHHLNPCMDLGCIDNRVFVVSNERFCQCRVFCKSENGSKDLLNSASLLNVSRMQQIFLPPPSSAV